LPVCTVNKWNLPVTFQFFSPEKKNFLSLFFTYLRDQGGIFQFIFGSMQLSLKYVGTGTYFCIYIIFEKKAHEMTDKKKGKSVKVTFYKHTQKREIHVPKTFFWWYSCFFLLKKTQQIISKCIFPHFGRNCPQKLWFFICLSSSQLNKNKKWKITKPIIFIWNPISPFFLHSALSLVYFPPFWKDKKISCVLFRRYKNSIYIERVDFLKFPFAGGALSFSLSISSLSSRNHMMGFFSKKWYQKNHKN